MKTSARNQLQGTVTALVTGAVNSEVQIDLTGGDQLTAIITNTSAEHLGLSEGVSVYALIKASSVIVAPADMPRTSARNQFCGMVSACREGAVNGEVEIELAGGNRIAAIITNESIRNLGISQGGKACALIKASSVILAVD